MADVGADAGGSGHGTLGRRQQRITTRMGQGKRQATFVKAGSPGIGSWIVSKLK